MPISTTISAVTDGESEPWDLLPTIESGQIKFLAGTQTSGTYSFMVTYTDDYSGVSTTQYLDIEVINPAPQLSAGEPYKCNTGGDPCASTTLSFPHTPAFSISTSGIYRLGGAAENLSWASWSDIVTLDGAPAGHNCGSYTI